MGKDALFQMQIIAELCSLYIMSQVLPIFTTDQQQSKN